MLHQTYPNSPPFVPLICLNGRPTVEGNKQNLDSRKVELGVSEVEHTDPSRIFDPHRLGWRRHWVVLTSAGCFLVPAERGGWNKRVPFTLDMALPELDDIYLTFIWEMLSS